MPDEEWLTTEEVLSYLMDKYDLTRDEAEEVLGLLVKVCPDDCKMVEH